MTFQTIFGRMFSFCNISCYVFIYFLVYDVDYLVCRQMRINNFILFH